MTGESAVTSISERSTYSLIFFKLGFVPSTRNLRKFTQPSAMIVLEWPLLKTNRAVIRHHPHGDHGERFALGRIDLARHDRGARLILRDLQFGKSGARSAG